MASLIKKPNSRFLWACFRDAQGRQFRRSTGVTNERKAREIARVYENEAKGKIKPSKFRQVLVDLHREVNGQDLPSATVEQFANDWLKAKKSETKPRSSETYENVIKKFLAFLGDEAQIDISLITKTHISKFRTSLTERVSPSSVNYGVRLIKMLFKAARRDGFLQDDPSEFVAVVKRDNMQGRRAFTLEEIRAILSVADPEWQSMIRFAFYSGQRLGDLARLTWENIDLQRNEMRFIASKTGKTMLLPIARPLREYILSLPAPDDPKAPLHPRSFQILRTPHGRVSRLSAQFADLLAAAGLRVPRYEKYRSSRGKQHGRAVRRNHSGVSFHSFRHTVVSMLKDAHVSEAVAMEFAGHDSREISKHYTHTGAKALQEAADSLPEI
jgi:integrase